MQNCVVSLSPEHRLLTRKLIVGFIHSFGLRSGFALLKGLHRNIEYGMEKFCLVWTKMICFGFMLLKIELTNGAVNIPTTGTPYIGDSFLLECHITPFTGTANWAKNGTTQTICGTTFCAPPTLGNYSFSYDASGISVTIDPVSTSDGGTWQCTHSSGTDSVTLSPTTKSNNPCKGAEKTTKILCNTHGTTVGVEVIIVIIIVIIDTQRVKIIVTAEKETKKLKSARQKINMGKEKTVPIKYVEGNNQHRSIFQECSIDVRGGDVHECVFETDAGVLRLKFMITDDLLNVQPGSEITLPTMLLVEPDYSSKQWLHDGNPIETNELLLHTIVTKSTYGIYDLEIMFDNLGLKILIKNMRVQARNWIVMMICVVVNVPLVLIGGGVTEHYRSTDGFCVDVIVTIIAFVLPIIVYFILVMVFICLFFLKKTGNEKNSGCGLPLGSCCQSSIKPNATESGQPNVVMITTENVWINTPIGRKMPDLPAIQLTNQTATGMEDKKQKKKKKKSKNQIKDSSRNDIQQSQEDTVQAIAD